MGMQIDDAWHQGQAISVHHLVRYAKVVANGNDAAAGDCHISLDWGIAKAVMDLGSPDDRIVHAVDP